MSKIPILLQEEHVCKRKRGEPRFKQSMCLEQKNPAWMKDIVRKVTKPGNLVVGSCAGTFPVVKSYMLFHKHKTFIGYDVDPRCMNDTSLQLILLYGRELSRKESDIGGEEDALRLVFVYVQAVVSIEVGTCADMSEVPEELPLMQAFPPLILY